MIRFQRPPEPPGFAKGTPRPRARGRLDETVWKPHKAAFSQAQHGKCGYCESYVAGTQDADVEHYAPKHAVADVSDDPTTWGDEARPGVANLRTGSRATIERSKTGYWWRAYDWTNYLFACTVCNRKYKETVFPLTPTPPARWRPTKRDRTHAPLLLNCFDDDAPWRHFEVDPTTGALTGKPPRGTATIATCGLHRDTLRIDRHRLVAAADHQLDEILSPQANPRSRANAWRDLIALGATTAPFAGAVRCLAESRLTPLRWHEIEAAEPAAWAAR
ncbi:MAG: hypothetical protein IPH44_02395 [Myxococcales bacterium]|nr:hypothetical protein [Myxococcales bacterium]MBP6845910.1 hypothetical protein [Kofleriaceae bacterium]